MVVLRIHGMLLLHAAMHKNMKSVKVSFRDRGSCVHEVPTPARRLHQQADYVVESWDLATGKELSSSDSELSAGDGFGETPLMASTSFS